MWVSLLLLTLGALADLRLNALLIAIDIWLILSSIIHKVKRRGDGILLIAHAAACLLPCVPHHHLPLWLILVSHQKWLLHTPLPDCGLGSTDCFVVHQYLCLLASHFVCSLNPDRISSEWPDSLTVVLTVFVNDWVSVCIRVVSVLSSLLDPLTLLVGMELVADNACRVTSRFVAFSGPHACPGPRVGLRLPSGMYIWNCHCIRTGPLPIFVHVLPQSFGGIPP